MDGEDESERECPRSEGCLGIGLLIQSEEQAHSCSLVFFVFLRNILNVLDILCLNARTTIGV